LSAISSILALEKRAELSVREVRTLIELKDLWQIDSQAYSNANIPFELFKHWWLAYPGGLHALFVEDKVIGAIGIWPVPISWMARLQDGSNGEADLLPEMIRDSSLLSCSVWYISGIVLDPEWQKTSAVAVLLREASIRWALDSSLSYPVTLYAIAISEHGERLLGKYGFSMRVPDDKMKDGYSLYGRNLEKRDRGFLIF
jgi:hypothetical protein